VHNTIEKKKDRNAILIILLICMIALGIIFAIFIYQQNVETRRHVDVISNPDTGIVPADGT
jgi:flagellar basal body-associated protein FliL